MAERENEYSVENVFCKWDICTAKFFSELEMGLHVITAHVSLLDYGQFVLDRRVIKNSVDADGGPEPKKPRVEARSFDPRPASRQTRSRNISEGCSRTSAYVPPALRRSNQQNICLRSIAPTPSTGRRLSNAALPKNVIPIRRRYQYPIPSMPLLGFEKFAEEINKDAQLPMRNLNIHDDEDSDVKIEDDEEDKDFEVKMEEDDEAEEDDEGEEYEEDEDSDVIIEEDEEAKDFEVKMEEDDEAEEDDEGEEYEEDEDSDVKIEEDEKEEPMDTPEPEKKMSEIARHLMNRIRVLPPEQTFLTSGHYCLICFADYDSPCEKSHKLQEYTLIDDYKRKFGSGEVEKKGLVSRLKQLHDEYSEQETKLEDTDDDIQILDSPSTSTAAAKTTAVFSSNPYATYARHRLNLPIILPTTGPSTSNGNRSEPESPKESRNGSKQIEEVEEIPPTQPEDGEEKGNKPQEKSRISFPRMRMSKYCQALIFRLRVRAMSSFRCSDRTQFCLNCLSFKKCETDHGPMGKRLEQFWKQRYGDEKISPESLIEQLEELKQVYVRAEADGEY